MDVGRSNRVVESPRKPLVLAEKNDGIGATRRSTAREVSSRYKSPTPKRCPSPTISRTSTNLPSPTPKRAISAERKRPSTPSSPPSPNTPVQDTSIDMHLAARKVISSRLPGTLWPSRMRSLNVSFQSDTVSVPTGKKDKPVAQALSDRTLKPSSNVAHKQSVTPPASRKATPERKRSPLKGRNANDQSENSKPVEGLHSRLVDQHRWPSRTNVKLSSNALSKSIDLSDKMIRSSISQSSGVGAPSLRRMSFPDNLSKPLQKASSDADRLVSSLVDTERLDIENARRIHKLSSSSPVDKITLNIPAVRTQSLPTGSRPASPTAASAPASRGVSPSRTRASNPPSRGSSPSRIRSSSPLRQPNNPNPASVLTFTADIKKGKKGVNQLDDVHHLRLLYNRQLQWLFANAQAEAVLCYQKETAEQTLYSVWRTTSDMRNSITKKRTDLQQLRLKLKLHSVLNKQLTYLNEWASITRDQDRALTGIIEDLKASTLRLPVTGGAKADIETVKLAICSAIQVMQTMGSSICSTLSKVEGTNRLISELADVAAHEREMLDECEALLASAAALQIEEHSLRTQLIQLNQAWKSGE